MAKYVKCGKNAFSFADPITGFNIVKGEIKEISNIIAASGKVRLALRGGHLEVVSKSDYDTFLNKGVVKEKPASREEEEDEDPEELTLAQKLEAMTKAELSEYYQSTYEVEEKDIEEFEALKKKVDMVNFLLTLEQEG